ncbi:hypothetical protein, partial [Aeromonas caviae]|uniref:hypothetical protein n=1 Tax=Aeromonas caviae TaxID=648 RepID=UPI002B490EA3
MAFKLPASNFLCRRGLATYMGSQVGASSPALKKPAYRPLDSQMTPDTSFGATSNKKPAKRRNAVHLSGAALRFTGKRVFDIFTAL